MTARLVIDGEWLVEQVDRHTCGAGGEWPHEPGCGLVPVMTLAELDALMTALGKLGAPINRPAEVIAAAGELALAPLHALFAGDPDTPCRTTWREVPGITGGQRNRVECVEVPLDELRAAFDEAERAIEGRA